MPKTNSTPSQPDPPQKFSQLPAWIAIIYSNEPIGRDGRTPSPHNWDIQLARNADNQMRVYCQFPETLANFRTAVGLYNPATEKPPGINLEALDRFERRSLGNSIFPNRLVSTKAWRG
jgi:hypothetical protein